MMLSARRALVSPLRQVVRRQKQTTSLTVEIVGSGAHQERRPTDATMTVALGDGPVEAERETLEAERVLWWRSMTDAFPEVLADESLMKIEPSRLFFGLASNFESREACDGLFERIDHLFPGAHVARASLQPEDIVWLPGEENDENGVAGFAFVDADNDRATQSVARMAPQQFRANQRVAERLFVPSLEEDPPDPIEDDFDNAPVFALSDSVLFPGQLSEFYIFESRYKFMVKECREKNRSFILLDAADFGNKDVVATACDVLQADFFDDAPRCGESKILARASKRLSVRLDDKKPSEFGLRRINYWRLLEDTAEDDVNRRELSLEKLRNLLRDLFAVTLGPGSTLTLDNLKLNPPNAANSNKTDWERFTWTLATWFHPYVDTRTKNKWLAYTNTLDRLDAMLDTLEDIVFQLKARNNIRNIRPPSPSSSK